MQQESTWCIKNMKHSLTHLKVPKTLCPPLLYTQESNALTPHATQIPSHEQIRPYSSYVVTCSYKPKISSIWFTWVRTEGPICIVHSHEFPKETADISIHPAVQTLQHTITGTPAETVTLEKQSPLQSREHRGPFQQAVSFTNRNHWAQCSLHLAYKVPITSSSSPAHRPSFPAGGNAPQRGGHCAFQKGFRQKDYSNQVLVSCPLWCSHSSVLCCCSSPGDTVASEQGNLTLHCQQPV